MVPRPVATWRALLRVLFRISCIVFLSAAPNRPACAIDDVLLQTMDGKIVTGVVDDVSFQIALGQGVFRQQFLSNFRSANPGFLALPTGNPNLPPDVAGFPSHHDLHFDLLPMTIDILQSNLLYWNGMDLDGNGLDLEDVHFVPPVGVTWDVFDDNFMPFSADATDRFVSGGLIQRTSSDIDPSDGVDTGSIHKHLAMQVSDHDSDANTAPPQGVYMIAWQARAAGFEMSDPFLFVMRTSMIPNSVRDLAADWAQANIEALTMPPAQSLPGDYNGDGMVDAADYVVWRSTLGQTGAGLPADGDASGVVDESDYDVWRNNYGADSGVAARAAAVIPEMRTTYLLAAALLGLWCVRHRIGIS